MAIHNKEDVDETKWELVYYIAHIHGDTLNFQEYDKVYLFTPPPLPPGQAVKTK